MKSFVTGAEGFIGGHLVKFLKDKGHEVYGTSFYDSNEFTKCDIRNKNKLKELIGNIKPDYIYHLAAQSFPELSREKPHYTIEANCIGTLNVLLAVKELKLSCRILNAGSSAEYGLVDAKNVPVNENHPLKPLHPYGVTKVSQENLMYAYHKSDGLDTFTMRIFNTTGPGKVGDVCSDFTKQLVKKSPTIFVGKLDRARAILDVRDTINGFYLAMEYAKAGEAYNICGKKAYLIGDILTTAISLSGYAPEIKVDEKLLRPTDEPIIFGDSTKFSKITKWKQEIGLGKTLEDMMKVV